MDVRKFCIHFVRIINLPAFSNHKTSFQILRKSFPRYNQLQSFSSKMETLGQPPTKRNIEIKARIGSEAEFQRRITIARELTKSDGEIIPQHDVFFNVSNGRLKLRYVQSGKSMLVQYARPDITGPKLSEFNILETDDPKMLQKILEKSVGVLGEVKKNRFLFLYEQTRIHLDKVDGLGTFLEFEVCLRPEQTIEEGTTIADELRNIFEIRDEDLMAGAYLDELMRK